MSALVPTAPSPAEVPIPQGTRVELDAKAQFVDRNLITGGSPWRLLRLHGPARATAARWQGGGVVASGQERLARTLVQQGLLHPQFTKPVAVDAVDVVIPVAHYNPSLRKLVQSLDGFSITIVDDGSVGEPTIAALANEFACRYVRLEANRGPAGARNAGAVNAERDFLWFIDDDVSMSDPRETLAAISTAFGDPLVAAVAPRVQGPDGVGMRERFEQHFCPLDMGAVGGIVVPNGPIGYVPSANLLLRRSAFGEGFDETLRVGEDVDLAWRLHDGGWLVRYDPAAIVTHASRGSWRSWWSQREGYGVSTGELARRHGDRLAPLRADQWTLIAWMSVLFGKPSVGAQIIRSAQQHAREKFFADADDPDDAAQEVVTRNMVGSGGPLARAVVRTFSVGLLVAALHPRLRKRALALFSIGTAWRWRRTTFSVTDVPLAVADDVAYGVGVLHGAWRAKTNQALRPKITKSAMSLREVLGVVPKTQLIDEQASAETSVSLMGDVD